MNPTVAQYLWLFDGYLWPVNEAIVDRPTNDYSPALSPDERTRAELEVEVMAWCDGFHDRVAHMPLVKFCQALHARIVELEARVAALEAAGQ